MSLEDGHWSPALFERPFRVNSFKAVFEIARSMMVRGIFGAVAIRIGSTLLAFIVSIILARILSPEGYGIYTYALVVVSFLAIPTQLGLPTLILRQIARYQYQKDWGLLKGLLLRGDQAILCLSLVIGCLVGIAVLWNPYGASSAENRTLLWAILLLPSLSIISLREGALQGLRRVVLGMLPQAVVYPLLFILLLATFARGSSLTPPVVMALACAASLFALATGALTLKKVLPSEVHLVAPKFDVSAWLRSALPFALLGGLHIVSSQIDMLMLGALSTKENVGLYRVAFSGAALVLFVLTAVGAVVSPNVARLHSMGSAQSLQAMVTFSTRLSLIAAVPVALLLIVYSGELLGFVYGPSYVGARFALSILCIGQICNVFTGLVHIVLNMTGHEKVTLVGVLLSVFLDVALNLLLIPTYGLTGAAFSAAISIVMSNAFLCYMLYLMTGISSLPFRLRKTSAVT